MTTLYISGPMSGLKDYNRPAFYNAEEQLRAAGFEVLNPARTNLGPDATWDDYMVPALQQVRDADGVALLFDWELSRGARAESDLARELGKPVARLHLWTDKRSAARLLALAQESQG